MLKVLLCAILCMVLCMPASASGMHVLSGNILIWTDAHWKLVDEQLTLATIFFRENSAELTEFARAFLQEYTASGRNLTMPEVLGAHGFNRWIALPEYAKLEFRSFVALTPDAEAPDQTLYGDVVLGYFEGDAIYDMHESWLPFVIYADTEADQVWTCTFEEYE